MNTVVLRQGYDGTGGYWQSPEREPHVGLTVEYSGDGIALYMEWMGAQVDLSAAPCRFEVAARLKELVGYHVTLPPAGNVASAVADRPFVIQPSPKLEPLSGEAKVRVSLRRGRPAYSYDVLGDGTELVYYSYDGVALFLDLELARGAAVGVGSGLPCQQEVLGILKGAGFTVADARDPSGTRPWLKSMWSETIPAEAGHRRFAAIQYTPLGPTTEIDVHGDGSIRLWLRSDDGLPQQVIFREPAEGGLDLDGVPCREHVRGTLLHRGFRLLP